MSDTRRVIREPGDPVGLPGSDGDAITDFRIEFTSETGSNTSPYCRVQQAILERLHSLDWTEDDTFGVQLALEEAHMNAIKHGHQTVATKIVTDTISLSDSFFRIVILDRGPGFDPDDVPDPTDEENLELPSNRGLLMMRTFMTGVDYNDKGNEVTMERLLGQPTLGELADIVDGEPAK